MGSFSTYPTNNLDTLGSYMDTSGYATYANSAYEDYSTWYDSSSRAYRGDDHPSTLPSGYEGVFKAKVSQEYSSDDKRGGVQCNFKGWVACLCDCLDPRSKREDGKRQGASCSAFGGKRQGVGQGTACNFGGKRSSG